MCISAGVQTCALPILENVTELEGSVADGDQQQSRQHETLIRLDPPQQNGADGGNRGESTDPGLAAAALVGDGAEHRRQNRTRDAGAAEPQATLGGALGKATRKERVSKNGGIAGVA